MTIQSSIKALGRRIVSKMKRSKKTSASQKRVDFMDKVTVVLANHMENLDKIKLNLILSETDGTSFFDLMDAIQSLLWIMHNTIRTVAAKPKQSWSDYGLDLLVGYDECSQESPRGCRNIV